MSTRRWTAAHATVALLALAVGGSALAAVHPAWRPGAVVVASVASVLLVVAGVLVHRPRGATWSLVALMLALWGAAGVLVQVEGRLDHRTTALVWAGQAVAAVIVVQVGRSGPSRQETSTANRLDLVVMATVLALVGAQLLAVAWSGRGMVTGVAVASVDVALLGVLLRFTLTRRGLPASSWLLLTGALLTIGYDLTSALHGRRLALPGELAQALGALCVLVIATAAVHPSMSGAFTAETFARRRRPSGALLGMLPLVLVPAGTWWVAQASGVPGLPGWTVPVTGAVVAGLCLLRAAAALRSSEHLAEHDPLTGLANRRGLSRAHADRDPATAHSLLLIDLDEFKQVNDTHGHDVGDALLLQVRDRLTTVTGRSGTVARLGGDEFVVLVPTACAQEVAERLLRSLEAPVVVEEHVLRVAASIGLASEDSTAPAATPPVGGSALAELLTHADVAMYSAKRHGGNRVARFHPDMRVAVARRYTLGSEIRRLLAGPSPEVGRLELHYQPLVELASGRAVGAEALVRWRHPVRGLLPPVEFLGVVNENDLDARLDTIVLEEVLDQIVRWREQGRQLLPISVNLTPDSLQEEGLDERVLAALHRCGLPTSSIHLEITEHAELPPEGSAARTLDRLAAAGIDVHLDDYGTGYTSLDYLRRFPVRMLKLDRSVVRSVAEDEAPLVAGVQAMADALDLDVLAEGVENSAQRDRLLQLGVRYAQGYLFSRPLPAHDFAVRYLGDSRDDDPGARPAPPALEPAGGAGESPPR